MGTKMNTATAASSTVLSAETWKRHANPWSVYTRFLSIPLLGTAIWSREWIGWWSLLAVALVVLWIWINPRLFPVPTSTDNWASRGVLGERIWLNRKAIKIPRHHARFATGLATASGIGALQFTYGVLFLDEWMVSYGMIVTLLTKAWFVDRMVWLYEDMRDATPEYRNWLY